MADDLAAKIKAIEALKADLDAADARVAAAEATCDESERKLQALIEKNAHRSESNFRCARWMVENDIHLTRDEMETLFERFAAGPQVIH